LFENATYEYTIEAWTDVFRSWQLEFRKKFEGGIKDLASETLEGAQFIADAASYATDEADNSRLLEIAAKLKKSDPRTVDQIAHWTELEALMATWSPRVGAAEGTPYA